MLQIREERTLRVFKDKVLKRNFGARGDEVTGNCRKLHNEEVNDLYCSTNIVRLIRSRRMKTAEHVARMGMRRGVYGDLVGKPERNVQWKSQD
jgi:hypothetical protein